MTSRAFIPPCNLRGEVGGSRTSHPHTRAGTLAAHFRFPRRNASPPVLRPWDCENRATDSGTANQGVWFDSRAGNAPNWTDAEQHALFWRLRACRPVPATVGMVPAVPPSPGLTAGLSREGRGEEKMFTSPGTNEAKPGCSPLPHAGEADGESRRVRAASVGTAPTCSFSRERTGEESSPCVHQHDTQSPRSIAPPRCAA